MRIKRSHLLDAIGFVMSSGYALIVAAGVVQGAVQGLRERLSTEQIL
jgi:hypothetical protein